MQALLQYPDRKDLVKIAMAGPGSPEVAAMVEAFVADMTAKGLHGKASEDDIEALLDIDDE